MKSELQSLGVKLTTDEIPGRKGGGAGPAEGIILKIKETVMSVPAFNDYVKNTPYRLHRQRGQWALSAGDDIVTVELPDFRQFYQKKTSDGKYFSEVALIHGFDCLATTVIQSCAYWGTPQSCKFCGIGLSLKNGVTVDKKNPSELAEVAVAAAEEIGVGHVTLTSGSTYKGNREVDHLAKCAELIKKNTVLGVQVQCRPPRDPSTLGIFKQVGVDSVAIHVDSFDGETLSQVAPNKAKIGLQKYIETWEEAVRIFGSNQVVSIIIVGLGETDHSVLEGVKLLAEIGVYPLLVPFRPIAGTPMGSWRPPGPDRMRALYKQAAVILAEKGITWQAIKAGCGRCTACSAMADYETKYA